MQRVITAVEQTHGSFHYPIKRLYRRIRIELFESINWIYVNAFRID